MSFCLFSWHKTYNPNTIHDQLNGTEESSKRNILRDGPKPIEGLDKEEIKLWTMERCHFDSRINDHSTLGISFARY